ncbi:MAG: cysteine--tRNA ligase [Phycisphaerales bacterium]|nr:cysteine--tRNA ligase [Phycisphaerales bacterium]
MTAILYNSLTNKTEAFTPHNPNKITFYTCGPTVYDDAHIGNFRSFLAADLLRRWLESPLCTLATSDGEHHGPRIVTHVMNITDVGHMTDDTNADGGGLDKMELAKERILEAKKSGKLPSDSEVDPSDPLAIARFYERRFMEDARMLGLKVAIEAEADPTLMPRATDNIEGMKQVICDLLDNSFAYAAGQPGARAVYFDVLKFQAYGDLSGNTLDQLKGGAGGRVDDSQQQEKHHPSDFLLWKEDQSHTMKWDAPAHAACEGWDQGYPGWHIECTAMALGRLVDGGLSNARKDHATIDLHSGGEDNIFPHHECEIAQSCCFTGNDHFANHWFHPRFLMVEGQKMSKSKGTMYTVRELVAKGIDPAAIRLELIKTHYRANADFSMQGLKDASRTIERWRRNAQMLSSWQSAGEKSTTNIAQVIENFADALSNDLNVSTAIAAISSLDISGPATKGALNEAMRWAGAIGVNKPDTLLLPSEPNSAAQSIETMIDESCGDTERTLAALHLIDNILGVIFRPIEAAKDTGITLYQPGVSPSPEIEALLAARRDAKKGKDFAAADAIRDQLSAMGLAIMDKPGGKVEVAPNNKHR